MLRHLLVPAARAGRTHLAGRVGTDRNKGA